VLGEQLGTRLDAIRHGVALLTRAGRDAPEARRLHDAVDHQALRARQLVAQALELAALNGGKTCLSRTLLPIADVVREALKERARYFAGRRVELHLGHEEIWVWADRARLLQVVGHLLSNALKFTTDRGRIRVELESTPAGGALIIEDDGAGIHPRRLPSLFRPFHQTPATPESLGLGLAIVQGLVALHGFRIQAASSGWGHGTSFRIDFPVADTSSAAP
jgi:signal transduction histidine kinase